MVSIQLVSPARGEPIAHITVPKALSSQVVSIQLVSPARGEQRENEYQGCTCKRRFPFNWFPLREGNYTHVS